MKKTLEKVERKARIKRYIIIGFIVLIYILAVIIIGG